MSVWVRADLTKWHGDAVIAAVKKKEAALTRAGMAVQEAAHRLVKVDTGNLKGSINYALATSASPTGAPATQSDGLRAHGQNDWVWVGTNVKYARRIEYGFKGRDSLGRNYNQAAQPYLRPAAENQKGRIARIIGDIMGPQIQGSVR